MVLEELGELIGSVRALKQQQMLRRKPEVLLRTACLIFESRPGLVRNTSCRSHDPAKMWARTHTVTPVRAYLQVIWIGECNKLEAVLAVRDKAWL
eukprot:1153042-Pelagomonas_calceolata.AAC.1